jgi:hypothetical protein
MPNPEKERTRAKMIHTLAEAQASRKPSAATNISGASRGGNKLRGTGSATTTITEAEQPGFDASSTASSKQKRKPKVFVKPPPPPRNFGGGRLGGGPPPTAEESK